MDKAANVSVGVVITDKDFNIKYKNSSAAEYIKGNNLAECFDSYPFLDVLKAKENFVDEKVRIFGNGAYYDLYCTGEFGDEYSFVFNGIQVSDIGFSFCRDDLREFIGDLKCYVSAIDSSINVMMSSSEKDENAFLKNAKANVAELSRILENCTGIAKAEEGRLPVERELLDVVKLIKKMVRSVLAYLGDDRIYINFRGREELVVYADYKMIRQAIVNILSASLSYINGACEIDIDVSVSGSNAIIRIINHFGGKYVDAVKTIFNRTAALCGNKKPPINSNTVSLAFAEKCIQLNGGKITFNSIRDGASFVIEIPILECKGKLCSEAVHLDLDLDRELFALREKRKGESDA